MNNEMHRKISITQKYFIYFLCVFLISIFIVGSYSYYVARNSILERTYRQLESVRLEKEKSIERYFNDRINELELLANTGILKELFLDGFNHNFKNNNQFSDILKFGSNYHRNIILVQSQKFAIIESNSKTLNVYFDSSLSKVQSLNKLIQEVKLSKKICFQDYTLSLDGNVSFFVGSPVFDEKEQTIGIIIIELDIDEINKIMYEKKRLNKGLGKSGESYIVGKDLLMRTSSRFIENSINVQKVETDATKKALKNQSNPAVIKDYRDVLVLSSYSSFNFRGLEWIIVAEIDKEEALQPIYTLRNSIILLCLIVSIVIFGFVYLGSIRIITPILELKDAALQISKGDYEIRLVSKTNDEMGELFSAFNVMSEQLAIQSEQINKDKLLRISAMLDAIELERKRLSRDLHDGLGQMLLAVKIKLEQSKNASEEKKSIYLNDALDLLKHSINEIRTISNNLTPTVLEMFGLEDGIKKLCRDLLDNSEIQYNFNCENLDVQSINSKQQIYIFRIIQEIINNIQKHSNASEAAIHISKINDFIKINAYDNGIGFVRDSNMKGNGIHNIYERVELLGGECSINSILKKGTEIYITIPIKQNEEN